MKIDKRLYPQAKNRISYIYVERARIEQTEFAVQIIKGNEISEIPTATVNAVFLGPGTTITHKAVCNLTEMGASIIWCGEELWRFYACGQRGTDSAKNILMQMRYHESKMLHEKVMRAMYEKRYPKAKIKTLPTKQLKSFEGNQVRTLYQELADKYNIDWQGRKYKKGDIESQNDINKSLTYVHQILYGIIRSVLFLCGFSTAIGFIHSGHQDSFVFDISDLYKESISIPVAFEVCSKYGFDREKLRIQMREKIVENKLMQKIIDDVYELFPEYENIPIIEMAIWDGNEYVKSGKNYGEN